MIKNLIFDFGDVFLDLDKPGAMKNALEIFKIDSLTEEMVAVNCLYEQGLISTSEFIDFYCNYFSHISKQDLIDIWNYVLKQFPRYKLDFLKQLYKTGDYQLILLSNTNELHIDWVRQNIKFYKEFKSNFHRFYLSHEINLRKPDKEVFEFVLNKNNLLATETLFIDDTKENTDVASKLGMHTWNIDETTEDIVNLFTIKKDLF
jgi:putative hydrolase of the HAD superfamily